MSDLIERKRTKDAVDCMLALLRVPQDMREEAIDLFINRIPNAETTGALDDAIQEYIKDGYILAEPKVGKWIRDGHHIRCNKCYSAMCYMDREGDVIPQNYCPNCGAKMEGSE